MSHDLYQNSFHGFRHFKFLLTEQSKFSCNFEVPCKRWSSVNRAWLQRFDDVTGVTNTDIFFCVKQWELNGRPSKNNFSLLQKVILHYGKKSLVWSLIIFGYLSFTTVRGQKNRSQKLWMYKIFKHRKLPCIPYLGETHMKLQWYNTFPSFFSLFLHLQRNFFSLRLHHQTSATKLRLLQGALFSLHTLARYQTRKSKGVQRKWLISIRLEILINCIKCY